MADENRPTPFTITTTIEIPVERVHNLIVSAFEGGSNHWLNIAEFVEGTRHTTPQLVWYGEQSVFEQAVTFKVGYDDPEKGGDAQAEKLIDLEALRKGLATMANKYASHFGDMMTENDDAETADVYMQCVVLGDVVYG